MHWPRLYSALERFRGNEEIKWLPIITVSYVFPFLLSPAGGQLQSNTKYPSGWFSFCYNTSSESCTPVGTSKIEALVPCHTCITESETHDHQSTAVAPH